MEEFEAPNEITDEQRQRAATRQMTVTPMDPFLQREAMPTVTILETHSNVERDSEDTSHPDHLLQPSPGVLSEQGSQAPAPTAKHTRIATTVFIVIVSVACGVLAGASLFVLSF